MLGILHTLLGALSLILGAQIFLSTKGNRRHIQLGWTYCASMICVNVSSLFIYRLTGRFNLFHGLAIGSLVMVISGVLQVRLRHRFRNWLWRHYQYMSWSYVGLLAATINEGFVRVEVLKRLAASTTPLLPLIASMLIVAVAGAVIFSRQRALLRRYGQNNIGPGEPGQNG